MNKGPQFLRFLIPILDVLKKLGGSAKSSDVMDDVIEKMNISEKELNEVLKNGESRIRNQIAWGRMYLVNAGYIDSSKRGVWTLTDSGHKSKLKENDIYPLFISVQSKFIKGKKETNINSKDDEAANVEEEIEDEINHKVKLINKLQSLSSEGFERICRRLLIASGLEKVEVTKQSGDGGIDGFGMLEVNPFVKFKVIFQSKKYNGNNPVSASHVRDFRGAMQGRADKGIIITTGRFSMEAKKEAIRDGVSPVELVDGDKMVELFEKFELGLKPKIIFEIDHEFFTNFI